MRRALLVPLVVVLFGATSFDPSSPTVSAQVGTVRVRPVEPTKQTVATVDEMIARVMSFDHDGDGAVGGDELIDRMRPLLDQGDRDGNGVLDRTEVRALASAPPRAKASLGFPFSGGYSLGDDIGFSSRSHLEGAIEDLRLDGESRGRALGVVAAFVESHASATLLEELEPLLTTPQLSSVRALLARDAATFVFRAAIERRPVVAGLGGLGFSVGATIQVEPNVTVGGSIRKVRAENGGVLVDAPVPSNTLGR